MEGGCAATTGGQALAMVLCVHQGGQGNLPHVGLADGALPALFGPSQRGQEHRREDRDDGDDDQQFDQGEGLGELG
jgi:hypothetical protein